MIDPTKARLCLLRVPWHGRGWVRLSLVMLSMLIAKNDSCYQRLILMLFDQYTFGLWFPLWQKKKMNFGHIVALWESHFG